MSCLGAGVWGSTVQEVLIVVRSLSCSLGSLLDADVEEAHNPCSEPPCSTESSQPQTDKCSLFWKCTLHCLSAHLS